MQDFRNWLFFIPVMFFGLPYLVMSSFSPTGWRPSQVVAELVGPTRIETGESGFPVFAWMSSATDEGPRTFYLCHMKDKSSFLTITDRIKSLGYALSKSQNCLTLGYRMITEAEFIAYQQAGQIDAELASVPVLSTQEKLAPYFLPALLMLFGLGAVAFRFGQWRAHTTQPEPREFDAQLTQVLCHAAVVSGLPPAFAAELIAGQISALTGQRLTVGKLGAYISSGGARLSGSDLAGLGVNLSTAEKAQVLGAVDELASTATSDELAVFRAALARRFGLVGQDIPRADPGVA